MNKKQSLVCTSKCADCTQRCGSWYFLRSFLEKGHYDEDGRRRYNYYLMLEKKSKIHGNHLQCWKITYTKARRYFSIFKSAKPITDAILEKNKGDMPKLQWIRKVTNIQPEDAIGAVKYHCKLNISMQTFNTIYQHKDD